MHIAHVADTDVDSTSGIVHYENSQWFNADWNDADPTPLYDMFYEANWGVNQYLNIWVKNVGGSNVGYAWTPYDVDPDYWWEDGVVINYDVWGACATSSDYNAGKTLTHEVGHYLGLEHTFEDITKECAAPSLCHQTGDLICDTPTQMDVIYDCRDRNSCGTSDPIHNYMGYSSDGCMTQFTEEQVWLNRLHTAIANKA
jgi:hypothetical protein